MNLPLRGEKVDKELLKDIVCFVIDNYYDTDLNITVDNKIVQDDIPLDLRYVNRDTPYGIYAFQDDKNSYTTNQQAIESLKEVLENQDISFADTIKSIIDSSDEDDAVIYKRACISRQAFNRIINNPETGVSKRMALALAVGLKLTVAEAQSFLEKAGYSLSKSNKQDLIVSYCLKNHIYEMNRINEILHFFGMRPLAVQ